MAPVFSLRVWYVSVMCTFFLDARSLGFCADFGRMQPALVSLPVALPSARSGPKPGRAPRAGRSAVAGAAAPGATKAGRLTGVQLADGAAEAQLQHGDEDWTPADEGTPAEPTKRFGRHAPSLIAVHMQYPNTLNDTQDCVIAWHPISIHALSGFITMGLASLPDANQSYAYSCS